MTVLATVLNGELFGAYLEPITLVAGVGFLSLLLRKMQP